jgi:hypothetical protein
VFDMTASTTSIIHFIIQDMKFLCSYWIMVLQGVTPLSHLGGYRRSGGSCCPRIVVTFISKKEETDSCGKADITHKNSQYYSPDEHSAMFQLKLKKKTPWSESASELYRPSDGRLSAK